MIIQSDKDMINLIERINKQGSSVWTSQKPAGGAIRRSNKIEDFSDQELMFELVKRGYCVMDGEAIAGALDK